MERKKESYFKINWYLGEMTCFWAQTLNSLAEYSIKFVNSTKNLNCKCTVQYVVVIISHQNKWQKLA